ncbi:hypothetical protein ACFVZ3_39205 [Kitasatospora purpeofusca]|uniref:hypothetical protein n=1 Tax=Kitasatospora purpeofusca TaxID=67352 RepID=UPI0036C6D427
MLPWQARQVLAVRFGWRQDGILQTVRDEESLWQFTDFAAVAFAVRAERAQSEGHA